MDKFGLLAEIAVEVADTPELRQKGLMWRERMDPMSGMLFDFEKPTNLSFWGKNTMMPLDIAFLDKDMKIVAINKINPMTRNSVVSPKPCRYALEVPRGFFKKHGVGHGCGCRMKGDRIGIYKDSILHDV